MTIQNQALTDAEDTYKVIAMSTGHLTPDDHKAMLARVENKHTMTLGRDTGWFLKLYVNNDADSDSNEAPDLSDTANEIIKLAYQAGYRMIEFDADADFIDGIPVFDV